MNKILVVEDEKQMSDLIVEYLSINGFAYERAFDGNEALAKFEKEKIDAILLDVMIPKIDGWSVCRKIREISQVPIIMITARDQEYDKLFGFELGVDDYIVKPFSPKEMIARLKVSLKRNKNFEKDEDVFEESGLKIDFKARNVYVKEKNIKLSLKEYELLYFLVKNKNRVLSRQQILDGVWGIDFFGDDRTVDTHIKLLRENLKEFRSFIVTVWGVGYKFEVKI